MEPSSAVLPDSCQGSTSPQPHTPVALAALGLCWHKQHSHPGMQVRAMIRQKSNSLAKHYSLVTPWIWLNAQQYKFHYQQEWKEVTAWESRRENRGMAAEARTSIRRYLSQEALNCTPAKPCLLLTQGNLTCLNQPHWKAPQLPIIDQGKALLDVTEYISLGEDR